MIREGFLEVEAWVRPGRTGEKVSIVVREQADRLYFPEMVANVSYNVTLAHFPLRGGVYGPSP